MLNKTYIIRRSTMDWPLVLNNNSLSENLNKKQESANESVGLKRKSEPESTNSPPKRNKTETCDTVPITRLHHSPKKKINIIANPETKPKFIYGNYSRYYGYRNPKDFQDVRLDVFQANKNVFEGKDILDIGCNSGFVTMEIAKKMSIKHVTGIDIDKGLINKATKFICKARKASTTGNREGFPFNVTFVHGNYVLRDDVLLECESPQFDLILCLSVTKWIQLNFGDNALKQAFRRMHAQLREGGKLILEAQSWEGYKRRKKLTPEIFKNYQAILFKPKDFTDYLLSNEVGFNTFAMLAVPDHCAEGFRRPIQIFSK